MDNLRAASVQFEHAPNDKAANLDASLLKENTGRRWILTRRPELYQMLAERTGKEADTRTVRFDHIGV